MSVDTEHRKLAAVVFTNMVGYSALARRNKGPGGRTVANIVEYANRSRLETIPLATQKSLGCAIAADEKLHC